MNPQAVSGIPWLDALLVAMGAWGYVATLVGGLLENLFLAGSLIPGETVVMVVAAAASRDPELNIFLVWATSVVGTVVGSTISYGIGRVGGRPLLDRIVQRFPRLTAGLEGAESFFERHGTKTVFLARFTAGFKNFTPTLAGVTRMRMVPFQIYTLLSAIVYSTGLALIGYYAGANMERVLSWFGTAGLWGVIVIVVLAVGYVAFRRWRRRLSTGDGGPHGADGRQP